MKIILFLFYLIPLVSFCQKSIKTQGFLIDDCNEIFFIPLKGTFDDKNKGDIRKCKLKKGFYISLTSKYYDTLPKSIGTKYIAYPNIYNYTKYIYVLSCELTYIEEKLKPYSKTITYKYYLDQHKISIKVNYEAVHFPINLTVIRK